MKIARYFVTASLLLGAAGPGWSQGPQQGPTPPNPMGEDPTRRPVESTDNDIIGRTDQTQKAMEAAAEARRKESRRAGNVKAAPGGLKGKPAKAADIVVGAVVTDRFGETVGSVSSVVGAEAVIATALGSIRVPSEALGKSYKGLLVDMTKEAFDKLVAQANATAAQ